MKINKNCLICQKDFQVIPYRAIKAKYCSKECRYKARIGIKYSEEIKNKISLSHKGKKHPWQVYKKHIVSCLTCGNQFRKSPSHIKENNFCSNSCNSIYNMSHSNKKNTSIEISIEKVLLKNNIKYEKQKPIIGKFVVDFLLEGKVVVECDGDYWHGKHEVIVRDVLKNAVLYNLGYKLFRLTEKEIKENADIAFSRVREYIKI